MTPALSRPDVRAVLEDAALEAGRTVAWGPYVRQAQRFAIDDASTDADDAAADADDAADDAAADAAADADDADDDAAADADAADAADDAEQLKGVNRLWRGAEMRTGLVLVQVPGRYWGVTRVGWARRVEGDEWELLGATTVLRTGSPVVLDVLAARGPGKAHTCTEPAQAVELLHRWSPRRVLVADERAWAKHVGPRPEGMP